MLEPERRLWTAGQAFVKEGYVKKIGLRLATGFGLGLCPVAPGTVGSLLGVLLAGACLSLDPGWQVALAVLFCVAAVPVCHSAEQALGKKDDGRIVADEYATFPLCLLGVPWAEAPWLLLVAFLLNRGLDVIKPPPAMQLQKLSGGLGIVADDVASSLYTLAVMHLIVRAL